MMKKLMMRLKNKCGESLVESMCAILIFTLASLLFFTMVTAATRINKTTRDTETELLNQMNTVECADAAGTDGTASIEVGSNTITENIKVVSGGDVFAYYKR